MSELGNAAQNWTCVCGRHASIEHPFGGHCYARITIESLLSQLTEAKAQLEDFEFRLSMADLQRDEAFRYHDFWKSEAEKLEAALVLLCYSIAGIEGTKMNSELPEWFRERLKEANETLDAHRAAVEKKP